MLTIGVESSCDETAVGIVENGRRVLSSVIASQMATHAVWGGVVPEIAAREHLQAIPQVLREALRDAGLKLTDIDMVGVTRGPGLVGCLLVGASFAKGLAQVIKKPIVAVNHVHAHVHGALLEVESSDDELFPCLALVVSGGHTNLYYMRDRVSFELMAHTLDDACGESFDKVGKMLGLPYPGGPHVEKLAMTGRPHVTAMPVMMERRSQLAFSYSGLKTAVSHALKQTEAHATPADIAWAFQEAALGQLVRKMSEVLSRRPDVQRIVVAGGVAANGRFRDMAKTLSVPCIFPALKYCSDNGAMIAAAAFFEGKDLQMGHGFDWDVFSRYPFELFQSKS